jgi:hypothetical protein
MSAKHIRKTRKTLLIISQVFIPDPASVGQHMADVAREMATRVWRVVVLTSARGYDDPSVRYPSRELWNGVEIVRFPLSSFGKANLTSRLFGQALFLAQCILRGVMTRGLDAVLVSTIPPMASAAALVIRMVQRKPVTFWVMDINPDEAVLLGKVQALSWGVRCLDWLNRWILRVSHRVVVLDRYMETRMVSKLDVSKKVAILPPWPHEDYIEPVDHRVNPFRVKHGLKNKFVFMYSGNMSIASPLTTVVSAALRFRDDPRLVFVFIGGGLGKQEVEEAIQLYRPANMLCLPYQPLNEIKYSLSAADVHFVTLGDKMAGVIHPCKVYGIMAAARPFIYVGPKPSHITNILERAPLGWFVDGGDVEGLVSLISELSSFDSATLRQMGLSGKGLLEREYGKSKLCGEFCDILVNTVSSDQS